MLENITYGSRHSNLTTIPGLSPHHLQQLSDTSPLSHEMAVERSYRLMTKRRS
jgi:hypothetical protein